MSSFLLRRSRTGKRRKRHQMAVRVEFPNSLLGLGEELSLAARGMLSFAMNSNSLCTSAVRAVPLPRSQRFICAHVIHEEEKTLQLQRFFVSISRNFGLAGALSPCGTRTFGQPLTFALAGEAIEVFWKRNNYQTLLRSNIGFLGELCTFYPQLYTTYTY